jgi:DNA-directed RNA polymerase specialized sigma subunit
MARVTRAVNHLSAEEIKQRLKHGARPWCRQRWLIIYNALIEPRKAEEIAKHCGVSKATVHQVISTSNRLQRCWERLSQYFRVRLLERLDSHSG